MGSEKTARLVKRLGHHRILWELSEPILTTFRGKFNYVVTVAVPGGTGARAFATDKYGSFLNSFYLPESRVQEVSHVESLKALGYVVE